MSRSRTVMQWLKHTSEAPLDSRIQCQLKNLICSCYVGMRRQMQRVHASECANHVDAQKRARRLAAGAAHETLPSRITVLQSKLLSNRSSKRPNKKSMILLLSSSPYLHQFNKLMSMLLTCPLERQVKLHLCCVLGLSEGSRGEAPSVPRH